jgi:AMP-polyphosphate phosphotransferase
MLQQAKSNRVSKAEYERRLPRLRDELLAAQSDMHTRQSFALALIVAGVPSAGRTEVISRLLDWLDPKRISVRAFGKPDREERQRPAMWRYWQVLPSRGRMTFFFTGWYSDYLATALDKPAKAREDRTIVRIRQLERMLARDGVRTVKIWLHIDAKTQRERLARLRADKLTRWRVTPEDRQIARHYKTFERIAQHCLKATNSADAPWHVVDGADDEYRLLAAGKILRDGMRAGLQRELPKSRSTSARAVAKKGGLRVSQPTTELPNEDYEREIEVLQARLARLVRRPRFRKHSLVLVFEGMDAAGKGGAIQRVTHALDARQYEVIPVSAPTPEELAHPYLWRFWRHIPKRGDISIFDRSWYGRVLVERVRGFAAAADWRRAYQEINEFELQLTERGIVVVKFWLQVGKQEQLRRFQERDQDPLKRFKVDKEDWVNREFYGAYQAAAAEMIERTDTPDAHWAVIAANDKRHARLDVLEVICDTLERQLG